MQTLDHIAEGTSLKRRTNPIRDATHLEFRGGSKSIDAGTTNDAGSRFYSDVMMTGDTKQLVKDNLNKRLSVPMKVPHFLGTGREGSQNIGDIRNSVNYKSIDHTRRDQRMHQNPPNVATAPPDKFIRASESDGALHAFEYDYFQVGGTTQREPLTDAEVGWGAPMQTVSGKTKLANARGLNFIFTNSTASEPYVLKARQNFMKNLERREQLV